MASNLFFHYTGGAANDVPDDSLGGDGSSERLDTTALNNLFDNINPDEIESGDRTEYRAIDLYNEGDETAQNVSFFLTDTPNAESILAVWLDVTGTQSIVNELTEPTGAAGNWTTPLVGSKLSLANLAASGNHRLWIRRIVDQAATNINADTGAVHTWFS
jgi:hypothetical protein